MTAWIVYTISVLISLNWISVTLSDTVRHPSCHAVPARASTGHEDIYGELTGPRTWPTRYPQCAGQAQSPINLDTEDIPEADSIPFRFIDYDSAPSAMTLSNNGHTLKVDIEGDLKLEGGGLPGTYKPLQFHFHWGSNDSRGSEHTVDSKPYPLEMHIVHYNTQYDPKVASNHHGGLAVLSILFEISEDDGDIDALNKVLKGVNSVKSPGQSVALESFPVADLLPDVTSYFRYMGSLTTPPCSEGVVWTIFEETNYVSEIQMAKFRSLQKEGHESLVDNFRHVQPLNDRFLTLFS